MEYKRIGSAKSASGLRKLSPEEKYWKSFRFPVLVKEYGSVNSIEFSKSIPHVFSVSASARIQIYSSQTGKATKTITKFNNVVKTSCFREDGKLLAVGDTDGLVQVFDVKSKACLRSFKGHNQAVNVVKFTANKTKLISVSDDKTIKLWDVTGQHEESISFEPHLDYVKALATSATNPNLFATGSYDHKVRLYDIEDESKKPRLEIDHLEPVEMIQFYPGDALIAVSGGPFVKIYDAVVGRCLAVLGNFEKTVTSIVFDGNQTRLIAGSLDQNLKIYDSSTFKLLASIRYQQPILSVGMSPDDNLLVVGMTSGLLSIKKRPQGSSKSHESKEVVEVKMKSGSYRHFLRTGSSKGGKDDHVVKRNSHKSLPGYDRFLRSFQYGKALDLALLPNIKTETTLMVIDELIARSGLKTAIAGRNQDTLNPVVEFVKKNLMEPTNPPAILELANELVEYYSPFASNFPNFTEFVNVVLYKINCEIEMQNDLAELKGYVDMITSTSEQNFSLN
ncbi:hypothetical protein BB559_002068 [Furculomyces boomerangus]|uniref:U3 small nucleolar RNA-associated protein 15 C-terminal domain-containing protein n=2 Tax=Furculomyces boomerangus TaxID=61424 RepID=A0A2T9YYD1_9FUNG|nr:hypothetical protein BB559_002068 [Furculomyces boomerangus]